MSSDKVSIAYYEEIVDLVNHPEKLLIDVRNKDEIEQGVIPTSIHIPLAEVEKELKLSDAEFKEKYNREKPKENDEVIFHCKMGGRAGKAAAIAVNLGFANVKNYKGSWSEYSSKQQ